MQKTLANKNRELQAIIKKQQREIRRLQSKSIFESIKQDICTNIKGEIISDVFEKEYMFIQVKKNGIGVELTFDITGNTLTEICVSEDVVAVVDEKIIF